MELNASAERDESAKGDRSLRDPNNRASGWHSTPPSLPFVCRPRRLEMILKSHSNGFQRFSVVFRKICNVLTCTCIKNDLQCLLNFHEAPVELQLSLVIPVRIRFRI